MSNHSLTGRGSDPPFSHESVVLIAHEQNICSKTLICRQLFAGHVVGFRPMKTKEKRYRMIIIIILFFTCSQIVKLLDSLECTQGLCKYNEVNRTSIPSLVIFILTFLYAPLRVKRYQHLCVVLPPSVFLSFISIRAVHAVLSRALFARQPLSRVTFLKVVCLQTSLTDFILQTDKFLM